MQSTIKKRKRVKHTRFPNGFGSICYLTGNRRRPYWVKKPNGFDERGYIKYITIGYFEDYEDAYMALCEYNRHPYDIKARQITFKQAAERWFEEFQKYPVNGETPSASAVNGYARILRICEPIHERKMAELTPAELQELLGSITAGSQPVARSLLNKVCEWAIRNGIIETNPAQHIHKTAVTNPKRNPFTVEEVREIWAQPPSEIRTLALVLLYTGMRVGEIFTISQRTDRFVVAGSKTKAGRDRLIPIHPLIKDLLPELPGDWRYVSQISTAFSKAYPGHTPHDCRRTFITRCLECGLDPVVSRKIVGHTAKDIHEADYTLLKNIDFLSEQIAKVQY